MTSDHIQRLQYLCKKLPGLLIQIPDHELNYKPAPNRWSKKQILGHLIDSATNNHQRFVRAQFEDVPLIIYNGDKWNECSYHEKIGTSQLISFWALYNLHLAEIVKNIPAENLKKECLMGFDKAVSLEFVFDDYVRHLEHHLKQIVDY